MSEPKEVIAVSRAMIDAGVSVIEEFHDVVSVDRLAEDVYTAMAQERMSSDTSSSALLRKFREVDQAFVKLPSFPASKEGSGI